MADLEIVERLRSALDRHDLDAFVECFHANYISEQPRHPGATFTGRDGVRANWTEILKDVPDMRVEVPAATRDGDTIWSEWRMYGTSKSGPPVEIRGVVIMGVRDDRVAWARIYLDPVEYEGYSLATTIELLTRPIPGNP